MSSGSEGFVALARTHNFGNWAMLMLVEYQPTLLQIRGTDLK